MLGQRGLDLGHASGLTITHSFSLRLLIESILCARWRFGNENTDVNNTKSLPRGAYLLGGPTQGPGEVLAGRTRRGRELSGTGLLSHLASLSRELEGSGSMVAHVGCGRGFQNTGAGARSEGRREGGGSQGPEEAGRQGPGLVFELSSECNARLAAHSSTVSRSRIM